MRLFPLASLLTTVLSVSACGTADQRLPDAKAAVCDVAAAYANNLIVEAKGHPIVFTTADQSFVGPISGGDWWTIDEKRPRSAKSPPLVLVKKLEVQGNLNAVARCPSVRSLLDQQHIGYGSKAVDAADSGDSGKLFTASINTISMPIVSADGKQAVLASSGVSGPLAGGGFVQFLERQPNGIWRVVAVSPLWIS